MHLTQGMRFDKKVVVVTGGASGIGRATALAFAREGARVAVVDRDAAGGEHTVGEIHAAHGDGVFMRADIANASDVERMIERVVHGWGRLDCAFNNAGVEGANATTREYDVAEFDRVIATNLRGTWLCMKYELAKMKRGAICNCASIAGLVGFAEEPAYVASKHGIVGLTRAAALEVAKDGIRVNCVCPGWIRTGFNDPLFEGWSEDAIQELVERQVPLGRQGTGEDIADVVAFLVSDDARYVNAHALVVDGGLTATNL
jgi:NAD(P)-dependent dehydrogenase (short-subunit alcohol dehydrogenase family)